MITLKPMAEEEFQRYCEYAIEDYAKEKVAAGNWSEDEAVNLSKIEFDRLLPKVKKPSTITYTLSFMIKI